MSVAQSPVVVKVGGYPFEPFVEDGLGVTPAFLTMLNGRQSKVRFQFMTIPAQRRYELMARGVIDAVFFEMPVWGWQEFADQIDVSKPILYGREMFVAMARNPAGENLFTLSPASKVALTLGYHYAFTDFRSDQAYIRTKVDAVFAEKLSETLRYLQSGAVDVGVMSNIFLFHEFQRRPELRDKLLLSKKTDHEYALPLIVRKGGAISANDLDAIIERATADGSLPAFFAGFGLGDMVISPQ